MSASFLERHYLLLRRLHSLSGIFPIGAFLLPHLTTNSSIVWGRLLRTPAVDPAGFAPNAGVETFQHEVEFIHGLPALVLIEWGVLFLPILFHAVLGVWFARDARPNVARYRYQANWRYTLQRTTGYIGVVFIFMHIASLRFGWTFGSLMPAFDASAASSSTANHFQSGGPFANIARTVFYLVCVLGLVFHFANGLWTAGITWGLTISVSAQQRWGWVCAVLGVGLGLAATAAIIGFATMNIDQAQAIERALASVH